MRQSQASSGVEGPTALYRQRGKPTRGDGPCEATTRAEVKTLIPFQGYPTSKYPAPLFVDKLMYCQPCVKDKDHETTTNNARPLALVSWSLSRLLGGRGGGAPLPSLPIGPSESHARPSLTGVFTPCETRTTTPRLPHEPAPAAPPWPTRPTFTSARRTKQASPK